MNQAASAPPRAIAGFQVGIVVLSTRHDLVRGNVQNALSFEFPVLYEVVEGISAAALMRGDPQAAAAIVSSARKLERHGVSVIVGACGSFANYQKAVADSVGVPVFMSILLEVPLLLRALPGSRELGIVFASVQSFTDQVCEQCGITERGRIVAIGAEGIEAFQPIMKQTGVLNSNALERGLVDLVRAAMKEHPRIGAWLIQCSDLPPYAPAVRGATNLPVFDMIGLINHVQGALSTGRWPGSDGDWGKER